MANTKASSELALTGNFIPSGVTMAFSGASAPSGWLLCNGSAVSRTTYAALYAVIGTAWGNGDGSSTFNLPDLRGRFLRGVDGGIARDPDRTSRTAANSGGNTGDAVGSVQGHTFSSHDHNTGGYGLVGRSLDGYWDRYNFGGLLYGDGTTAATVGTSQNAGASGRAHVQNVPSAGGNENRPLNANVNYIIKI